MSQKIEKPVLSGQRIKTRKRGMQIFPHVYFLVSKYHVTTVCQTCLNFSIECIVLLFEGVICHLPIIVLGLLLCWC